MTYELLNRLVEHEFAIKISPNTWKNDDGIVERVVRIHVDSVDGYTKASSRGRDLEEALENLDAELQDAIDFTKNEASRRMTYEKQIVDNLDSLLSKISYTSP